MSEPLTATGRKHLQWLLAGDDVYEDDARATVLAIEAEAAARDRPGHSHDANCPECDAQVKAAFLKGVKAHSYAAEAQQREGAGAPEGTP